MHSNTENIFLSLDIAPNTDLHFFQDKPYNQFDSLMKHQIKTQTPQVKSELEFFDFEVKKEETVIKSNNKKNAFIKKINSLMSLQTTDNSKVQFIQNRYEDIDKVKNIVSDRNSNSSEKKLQRNRNTARISRMRKKYYIDLLEKKLEQITEEMYYQSQNINSDSDSFKIQENDQVLLVKQTQQDILNKLRMGLINNSFSEKQVLLILQNYQSKVGPNGFLRKLLIDRLFEQLKDSYLPQGMKSILKNSDSSIFSEFQPELQQISSNYSMLMQQLEQIKNNYLQTNRQIENLVNEVTDDQKPSQFAHLILNFNQIDRNTENLNKDWFFNNVIFIFHIFLSSEQQQLLEKSQQLQKHITQNNNNFLSSYNQINDCMIKKIKLDQL